MTNDELIQNWLNHRGGTVTHGGSLHTDGDRLFSYDSVIMEHSGENAVRAYAPRCFSVTTAKHLALATRIARAAGFKVTL
jgi:hypothetical protein